jgi:hypothetical protein
MGRIDDLDPGGAAHFQGGFLSLPTYTPPPFLATVEHKLRTEAAWRDLVGTPRSVRDNSGPLFGSPEQMAAQVIAAHTALLRLNPQNLSLRNVRHGPAGTTLSLRQHVNGVRVLGGGVAVVLAEQGRVVRIANRFLPFATGVATIPGISQEEALRAAAREIGRPPETPLAPIELIIYPVDGTAYLAWRVALAEWTVFVDASGGSILGVERAVLSADGFGQVWLPNPHVARQDSTVPHTPTTCDFSDIYRTVPIRGVTDSAGVWQLKGPRIRHKYNGTVLPFQTTTFPPQFISTRCIGGQQDPNGRFQQTLAYYFLDNAIKYLYQHAGLVRDSCPNGQDDPCALPMRIVVNGPLSPHYSTISRDLNYTPDHLEDAELVFHEFGHAIHHDQSGEELININFENPTVNEGGVADFFATNLLAHEPLPYEFLVAEWWPYSGSRFMLANSLFPWHWSAMSNYRDGHILANALWDVFKAFEGQPAYGGPCAPLSATGANAWVDSCLARNQFYKRFAHALGEATALEGLSFHSVAESMLEADEMLSGGQNLPVMMRAFNRHGWFFTEHDRRFGIEFATVSTPRDTTAHGPRFVAMRLTTDSGVAGGSVYLHYGLHGEFPDSVAMVLNPLYGTGVYTGIIPDISVTEQFIDYYISAKNGKGVLAHWPKGAPFDDYARFRVGATFRSLHAVEQPLLLMVPPGAQDSLAFSVNDPGLVRDLNVRVKVSAKRIGFSSWRIAHLNGPTYTTRDLIGIPHEGLTQRQISWPTELDVWFDDERDAFFHQFRPYRYFVDITQGGLHPLLSDFNNQPRAGTWRLVVDNRAFGADTLFIRGWGVQLAELTPVGIEESLAPSLVTRLGRAFPNPVHHGARIPITIASDGPAQVKVFDVAGRLVRVVLDGHVLAGEYIAEWDGRNQRGLPVSSGVYFIRLTAREVTADEKVIVLR